MGTRSSSVSHMVSDSITAPIHGEGSSEKGQEKVPGKQSPRASTFGVRNGGPSHAQELWGAWESASGSLLPPALGSSPILRGSLPTGKLQRSHGPFTSSWEPVSQSTSWKSVGNP